MEMRCRSCLKITKVLSEKIAVFQFLWFYLEICEAVCRCMFQASHSQPYFLSLPAATNFFSRVMFICGFALFDLFSFLQKTSL